MKVATILALCLRSVDIFTLGVSFQSTSMQQLQLQPASKEIYNESSSALLEVEAKTLAPRCTDASFDFDSFGEWNVVIGNLQTTKKLERIMYSSCVACLVPKYKCRFCPFGMEEKKKRKSQRVFKLDDTKFCYGHHRRSKVECRKSSTAMNHANTHMPSAH